MKIRIFFNLFFVAICLCMTLSGCGDSLSKAGNTTIGIKYPPNGIYPIDCGDTLTVWMNHMGDEATMQTAPIGIEWMKQTGVNVEFQQISMSSGAEALSLLIASNDLPDIMCTNLDDVSGGVQKYVNEGAVIALDENLASYAPNLKKYLDSHLEIAKAVRSDDGKLYRFPMVIEDESMGSTYGLAVRGDILKKGEIAVPETIDEWYDTLKYFKSKGFTDPLSYDIRYAESGVGGFFMGAYGVCNDFYLYDGKVKHGLLEPEMKDALTNLNKWYEEGLLDKNIVSTADLDAKILNSETGATSLWIGGGMGKYMRAAENMDIELELVPALPPVLNKGDRPQFGYKEFLPIKSSNGFITSACKNVELAMRFLDYGYSEKGHMLLNFGIEGVSYNMVNGYPTYTDIILRNPDGLSMTQAMGQYFLASNSGPFIQDRRYLEQYYELPQQKEALRLWGQTDAWNHRIPMISFTEEEARRQSSIINNVKTFSDEMVFKFIMGIEPLDKYDAFVEQVKALGLAEAVSIYEDAVKRFNNR